MYNSISLGIKDVRKTSWSIATWSMQEPLLYHLYSIFDGKRLLLNCIHQHVSMPTAFFPTYMHSLTRQPTLSQYPYNFEGIADTQEPL